MDEIVRSVNENVRSVECGFSLFCSNKASLFCSNKARSSIQCGSDLVDWDQDRMSVGKCEYVRARFHNKVQEKSTARPNKSPK